MSGKTTRREPAKRGRPPGRRTKADTSLFDSAPPLGSPTSSESSGSVTVTVETAEDVPTPVTSSPMENPVELLEVSSAPRPPTRKKKNPTSSASSATETTDATTPDDGSAKLDPASIRRLKRVQRMLYSNCVNVNANPEWPPLKLTKFTKCLANDFKTWKAKEPDLDSLATLCDGIYTKRSSLGRHAGLGLYADRNFAPNELVTEFVGYCVDREEAMRMRANRTASHVADLEKPFYYIDGEKYPNPFIGGGSFANDGHEKLGGPGNNTKFYKIYDKKQGRSRLFLKAIRSISPGEEILVGYSRDYWTDVLEEDIRNGRRESMPVPKKRKA